MLNFLDDPEEYNDSKMLNQLDANIKKSMGLAQRVRAVDQEIASSTQYLQKVGIFFFFLSFLYPWCLFLPCPFLERLPHLKDTAGGRWKITIWEVVCPLVSSADTTMARVLVRNSITTTSQTTDGD